MLEEQLPRLVYPMQPSLRRGPGGLTGTVLTPEPSLMEQSLSAHGPSLSQRKRGLGSIFELAIEFLAQKRYACLPLTTHWLKPARWLHPTTEGQKDRCYHMSESEEAGMFG